MTEFVFLLVVIGLSVAMTIYALGQYLREQRSVSMSKRRAEHPTSSDGDLTPSAPEAPRAVPSALAEASVPRVSPQGSVTAPDATALPVTSQPQHPLPPPGALESPASTSTASLPPSPSAMAQRPLLYRASERRGSLLISQALPPEIERARLERELEQIARRSRRRRRLALIAGAILVGLFPLYWWVPSIHERLSPHVTLLRIRLGLVPPPPPPEPTLAPRDLEVSYSNELQEKDGKIILTGTVRNVSSQKTFSHLFAELSLIRKDSRLIETRVVAIKPATLTPGQEGRYELVVSASEFIGNRKVRIFADEVEIPYRYVLPEATVEMQMSGSSRSEPAKRKAP